jgi:hypothetical protein
MQVHAMSTQEPQNTPPAAPVGNVQGRTVVVNDTVVAVKDGRPTPREILELGRFSPPTDFALIQWPTSGPTRDLPLDEPVELMDGRNNFFAFKSDGAFFFMLNDARFEWKRELFGHELRQVGRVPADHIIFLDHKDHGRKEFGDNDRINLDGHGVESFYTEHRVWKIDVQGDVIPWPQPTIIVSQALEAAGFDITKPWIITLKVKDQPKRSVTLSDVIDLNEPGLERLRVLKGQVNNGDGNARRQFSLLPRDDKYLDGLGITWHTVMDGGRWLLLDNYPLPKGYAQTCCTIAISVPGPYPAAQLDMFYCHPPLARVSSTPIPQTEHTQIIDGRPFQRWSRHHAAPWAPDTDCVRTHMGLVDESIYREVEL